MPIEFAEIFCWKQPNFISAKNLRKNTYLKFFFKFWSSKSTFLLIFDSIKAVYFLNSSKVQKILLVQHRRQNMSTSQERVFRYCSKNPRSWKIPNAVRDWGLSILRLIFSEILTVEITLFVLCSNFEKPL